MKKVLDKHIKKITISLFVLFVISIAVLVYVFIPKNGKVKTFSNDIMRITYDNSWRVDKSNDTSITLNHGKNASILIESSTLDDEYRLEEIGVLASDIIYGINNQNSDYVLLAQDEITIDGSKGIKLLYETSNSEVLLVVLKRGADLITFTYEAEIESFDILLDSVLSILYKIEFVKEKIEYQSEIKIDTSKLSLPGKDKAEKTREYTIENRNHKVVYTMPENYIFVPFQSEYHSFKMEGDGGYFKYKDAATIYVRQNDIYSYVESKTKFYDNKEEYDFKVSEGYVDNSYIVYIKRHGENSEYTSIYYAIQLDKTHLLDINFSTSASETISEDILKSIEVKSSTRYASKIEGVLEGDYVTNKLMQFISYSDESKYYEIKTYTPKKYEQDDQSTNSYKSIYYGKKSEKQDVKDDAYEILINYNLERSKCYNRSPENYKNIHNYGTVNYSGYDGTMYTYDSGNSRYAIIDFALSDSACYTVTVITEDTNKSKNLLKNFTKFEVSVKDYEQ